MFQINFNKPCKIHFMGIGGISMSGFAKLLNSKGFTISGSDRSESPITKDLEALGIKIQYEQKAQNITDDIDLVVYTAAISPDNEEFIAAKEKNIPMMDRAKMVGQVMKNYKDAIAISGTHGKTTTTSIASHILLSADLDPTISVGGILPAINGNIRIGDSPYFVTEACEYTNSFLKFAPTIGIILNIEEDHLDFFKDINDIRHSFNEFAKLLPEDGTLIINAEIDNYEDILKDISCNVLTFSLEDKNANFFADNISYDEKGCGSFDLIVNGEKTGHYHLSVVGKHNISNCLSCIAMASLYDISPEAIQSALDSFQGTDRRFQYKGKYKGITIIDDYAHHPTEIEATLSSAKNYPHKNMWVVFQPHTYTRTRALLKDFANVLSKADNVILADIYAAREKDPLDISSKTLADEIEKLGKKVHYIPSFEEIEKFISKNLVDGDLLITMGAGNVVDIGDHLLKS